MSAYVNFGMHFEHSLNKGFKPLSFSIFTSKIKVSIVVGFKGAANVWGQCSVATPAISSASLLEGLPESQFCLCCVLFNH